MTLLKKHLCKILLAVLQIAFLGAGPIYLKEFTNLVNELQEVKREVILQSAKLQKTGESIKNTGDKLTISVETVTKVVKKAEKACKKIRF